MKISKPALIIFLLFTLFFVSGCTWPSLSSLTKNKKAALQVVSQPKTTVFLNEEHLGQTTYLSENLKPGDYTLKLVPESTEGGTLKNWQGMVKLSPGIMTVVNRNLAENEDQASGYVLTLEPIVEKDKARLSVISTPDNVVVSLDEEPKGFSPLSLDNLTEGEHILGISSPGFQEEKIKAKTVKGYKLVINVQLARQEEEPVAVKEATPSASPAVGKEDKLATNSGSTLEKPYVKIKNTPTGFLNVRATPSTAATILVKIKPGETYKFIEANQASWYKIEYSVGKFGWISRQYADLFQ